MYYMYAHVCEYLRLLHACGTYTCSCAIKCACRNAFCFQRNTEENQHSKEKHTYKNIYVFLFRLPGSLVIICSYINVNLIGILTLLFSSLVLLLFFWLVDLTEIDFICATETNFVFIFTLFFFCSEWRSKKISFAFICNVLASHTSLFKHFLYDCVHICDKQLLLSFPFNLIFCLSYSLAIHIFLSITTSLQIDDDTCNAIHPIVSKMWKGNCNKKKSSCGFFGTIIPSVACNNVVTITKYHIISHSHWNLKSHITIVNYI